MPADSDDAHSTRTKSIADNLGKELKRIAMRAPWRKAEKFVDLLGVAQAVYAVEDLVPTESNEAQLLRAAALRFERLLLRRRDKLSTEKPLMTEDARARFDKDIEAVRRYTHLLNAEARVALAVRDAFDGANESFAENHKIFTSLSKDGPLVVLTSAATRS